MLYVPRALQTIVLCRPFPVVTFSNTPGVFTDLRSEELCQGEAIARSLRTMFGLKVLDASSVMCEGGSEVLSKFDYPWLQAADLSVKRRSSYLISQFKPLKEKVKPVTLDF